MEYGVSYFLFNFGVAIYCSPIGHVCSFVVGVGKWVGLYSLRITPLFNSPPFLFVKSEGQPDTFPRLKWSAPEVVKTAKFNVVVSN